MDRIFLFTDTVNPIAGFDFRVTIIALQAVRGMVIERKGWPDRLSLDDKVMARFLDIPIVPTFLDETEEFDAYESRYQSRISELTGHSSHSKHFIPQGKTFRDFAEHRLGTTIEFALFSCLMNMHRAGRATIPSFDSSENLIEVLKRKVSQSDSTGMSVAMELIVNPLLESPGNVIVQMNPPMEREFPNIKMITQPTAVGKTFADLMSDAVYALAGDRAMA